MASTVHLGVVSKLPLHPFLWTNRCCILVHLLIFSLSFGLLLLDTSFFFTMVFLLLYFVYNFINSLVLSIRWESLDFSLGSLLDDSLVVFAFATCLLRESKHLHVMLEYLLRQALKNPLVVQGLQGRHAVHRRPLEALHQEVHESLRLRVTQPPGR